MSRIRLLPEHLINRIAAGEVVERPASVLKELIENSLDAGADELAIEAHAGGRSRILVSDNGQGMGADDVLLAIERHATSKLADDSDLMAIPTLGFRGEALASIAAVSRFSLISAEADDGLAHEVRAAGGVVHHFGPAARARGSSVEVRDLFHNVPARRKFLRTTATEAAHLAECVHRYVLSRPNLTLSYTHNGRLVLAARAGEAASGRLAAVLGRQTAQDMFAFEEEQGGVSVSGFLGRPSLSRARSDGLHTFINGRPAREPLVTRALVEAYQGRLGRARFPVAVVHVALAPGQVDVNVHPAKTQVRFVNPGRVRDVLAQVFIRALRADPAARSIFTMPGPQPWEGKKPAPEAYPTAGWLSYAANPRENVVREGFGPPPAARPAPEKTEPRAPLAPREPVEPLTPLAQLMRSFILAECAEGLAVLDQHAAHERVLFERIMGRAEGTVRTQGLLFPLTLELSPARRALLEEARGELAAFGFEIEPFGGETVLVSGLPALMARRDPAALLEALLDELDQLGARAGAEALERALASTLACHAAVKAGEEMSQAEMERLLADLAQTRDPTHCPHGRPLVFTLDAGEIKRRFKRV